ncbi:hypothetical protein NFI96_033061, partial [Prochilodus magdalenae]
AGNGKAPGNRGKLKSGKSVREDDQGSETSQGSVQSGVLNWLSNGFVSTLPQPAGTPLLHRANSDAKPSQEEGSDRPGVIGWISQGIGKVVPQPEAKYTQNVPGEPDEPTEVYNMEEIPDAEPLPHIPVVEMVSEDEVSEMEPPVQFQPRVVDWIKSGLQNALPHTVPRPPDSTDNSSQRSSRCSNKVFSPPPESVTSLTEVDAKVSMMGWIVHGLGLALPQPVIRSKEENGGVEASGHKAPSQFPNLQPMTVPYVLYTRNQVRTHDRISLLSVSPAVHVRPAPVDMVLEEVGPEEVVPVQERRSELASSKSESSQVLRSSGQAEPVEHSEPEAMSSISIHPSAQGSCTQWEDAETQTGRWTPFIENIKKEAENNALATMEERLRQERLEMARMAEEVARQTAEMAVRELAKARLAMYSTIVEVEEETEPETELQVLRDEESEVEISQSKVTECEELSRVEEFVQDVAELEEIVENPEEAVEDPREATAHSEETLKPEETELDHLEEEVDDLEKPEDPGNTTDNLEEPAEEVEEDLVDVVEDPEEKPGSPEEAEQTEEAEGYTEEPCAEEPKLPSPPPEAEPEPASPEPVRAAASPVEEPEPKLPSPPPEAEPEPASPEPVRAAASPVEEPDESEDEDSEDSSEAESESAVITQQPKPGHSDADTQEEGALTEEGSEAALFPVPSRCDALKACLMRIPYTHVCLDRFSQLLKENDVALPKVPPMPKLPERLSRVTQQLPSLPTRLNHLPQQLTSIPQQISERASKLPQQFPSFPPKLPTFPQQFPSSLPQGLSNLPQRLPAFPQRLSNIKERLSNIPERLSNVPQQISTAPQQLFNVPQHLSSFPQRARQCYATVQNRLNSLRPVQDA